MCCGGACDPSELLFPCGDATLLTRLYRDSTPAALMNSLAGQAASAMVSLWPAERPLRVLEIGAGTGATTWYILPHLPKDRTEYVFTDVDDGLLHQSRETLRRYPFVRFARLNIEHDPAPQGFASQRFDMVVAANVLHATANLRQSLEHVHRLMAPDGLLVLTEGIRPLRFLDLTFGLTEGWWRFTGDPVRPSYPLIGPTRWEAVLAENGFEGGAGPSGRMRRPRRTARAGGDNGPGIESEGGTRVLVDPRRLGRRRRSAC